jgi:predicted kinase
MIGIPGSGKSTKAKSMVGNGIIHSTDDLIEATGDYNEFFKNMMINKDFGVLSNMHKQNLKNAIKSMKDGITPVIIDNTNLSPSEPKQYVMAALEMGYDDKNIKFINIGTGGLTAEELAKRNTHNVPLDKIKSMIDKYKTYNPITIEKVINSKDMGKKDDVLYSAIVLDEKSHNELINMFSDIIPEDWKLYAHHMTIQFGKGVENEKDLDKEVILQGNKLGISDKAIAIEVSGYESKKNIPHITIAISPDGSPKMSNDISDWKKIKPITLTGVVKNILKK